VWLSTAKLRALMRLFAYNSSKYTVQQAVHYEGTGVSLSFAFHWTKDHSGTSTMLAISITHLSVSQRDILYRLVGYFCDRAPWQVPSPSMPEESGDKEVAKCFDPASLAFFSYAFIQSITQFSGGCALCQNISFYEPEQSLSLSQDEGEQC